MSSLFWRAKMTSTPRPPHEATAPAPSGLRPCSAPPCGVPCRLISTPFPPTVDHAARTYASLAARVSDLGSTATVGSEGVDDEDAEEYVGERPHRVVRHPPHGGDRSD